MRKNQNIKKFFISVACFVSVAGLVAGFVVWRTKDRVQIEFDIHINQNAIYLSTYSESPQFAIWLENPKSGQYQQVFVTYRSSRGDWEGKADVPVALPRWRSIFRGSDINNNARSNEEIAISGATPKVDYFRVRAEVKPCSEWICWIEMNLAGDFNEFYPQFNTLTMQEDEFACGQPALLYKTEIKADEGKEYTPVASYMSFWKDGKNSLAPIDKTITTAKDIFDKISIFIIKPKPMIINKNKVEQQNVLK